MTEKSLLEFPCSFPIKMMGRDTTQFRYSARELVERHTGPLNEEAISEATSRNGNFVSLTFTVIAMSQDQLDDIYRDASSHDDVLMAL